MKLYRTTFLDPDNRREPKTDDNCVRCHRDFKTTDKFRWVHIIEGGASVLHPEDEGKYNDPAADLYMHKIGMACARKIGIEFTSE